MELKYLQCIVAMCMRRLRRRSMTKFKMVMRLVFFYCFAGGVYMTLELLYRQYTDYHMFYLAGIIGLIFLCINEWLDYETDFSLQVFICGISALIGELICGLTFNADYHIWDYRELPFNFMGHIQLHFAIIWFVLAAIFIPILDYIDYYMFPRKGIKKPYYKIFGKTLRGIC